MLAAWLLLAAAPPAMAQQDTRRAAEPLWDKYPLDSSRAGAAQPAETPEPSTIEAATGGLDGAEQAALLLSLALLGGGAAGWLLALRAPRANPLAAARPIAVPSRASAPRLWAPSAGAPTSEPAPAPAPVVAGPQPARSPGAPAPPDPDRAWAAEIEWHQVDGASQFSVMAHAVDGGEEPHARRVGRARVAAGRSAVGPGAHGRGEDARVGAPGRGLDAPPARQRVVREALHVAARSDAAGRAGGRRAHAPRRSLRDGVLAAGRADPPAAAVDRRTPDPPGSPRPPRGRTARLTIEGAVRAPLIVLFLAAAALPAAASAQATRRTARPAARQRRRPAGASGHGAARGAAGRAGRDPARRRPGPGC